MENSDMMSSGINRDYRQEINGWQEMYDDRQLSSYHIDCINVGHVFVAVYRALEIHFGQI